MYQFIKYTCGYKVYCNLCDTNNPLSSQLQDEGPMTPARPIAAATPQPRSLTPPKRPVKPQQKVTATPLKPPKVMSSSSTQTTPFKGDKKIPTGNNGHGVLYIYRAFLLSGEQLCNLILGTYPVSRQLVFRGLLKSDLTSSLSLQVLLTGHPKYR